MMPVDLDETFTKLAALHLRTHHGEIKAALEFWAEIHGMGEQPRAPLDPPKE